MNILAQFCWLPEFIGCTAPKLLCFYHRWDNSGWCQLRDPPQNSGWWLCRQHSLGAQCQHSDKFQNFCSWALGCGVLSSAINPWLGSNPVSASSIFIGRTPFSSQLFSNSSWTMISSQNWSGTTQGCQAPLSEEWGLRKLMHWLFFETNFH